MEKFVSYSLTSKDTEAIFTFPIKLDNMQFVFSQIYVSLERT